jgi:hypothetical protein
MPMTRQRARSSFTLEIRRSNRRSPEVISFHETSPTARQSLADQVFGKSSTTSDAPAGEVNGGALQPMVVRADGPGETLSEAPPVRRILPDLLSIPVDPVEERAAREAVERAARRNAQLPVRARKADKQASLVRDAEPAPAAVAAVEDLPKVSGLVRSTTTTAPAGEVAKRCDPERKPLKARAMRAERNGGVLPRLPAGQRWKRRLPKACW